MRVAVMFMHAARLERARAENRSAGADGLAGGEPIDAQSKKSRSLVQSSVSAQRGEADFSNLWFAVRSHLPDERFVTGLRRRRGSAVQRDKRRALRASVSEAMPLVWRHIDGVAGLEFHRTVRRQMRRASFKEERDLLAGAMTVQRVLAARLEIRQQQHAAMRADGAPVDDLPNLGVAQIRMRRLFRLNVRQRHFLQLFPPT